MDGWGHNGIWAPFMRENEFLNLVKLDWVWHLSPLKKGVVPIPCLM